MPILRHHLEHALGHRLLIGVDDLVVAVVGRQQAVALGLPERLERQVRIDRVGPIADEQAVVMHFAGFARFQDDADLRPLRLADQVMMHRPARPAAS